MDEKQENDFTKLEIWKQSHQLMLDIYELCKLMPAEEKYITTDQIKRSSSSVPANISEGHGRFYYQDNISFCRKARGSLDETRNHLIKIRDLNFIESRRCNELLKRYLDIRKMINGYIRYLNNKKPGSPSS